MGSKSIHNWRLRTIFGQIPKNKLSSTHQQITFMVPPVPRSSERLKSTWQWDHGIGLFQGEASESGFPIHCPIEIYCQWGHQSFCSLVYLSPVTMVIRTIIQSEIGVIDLAIVRGPQFVGVSGFNCPLKHAIDIGNDGKT